MRRVPRQRLLLALAGVAVLATVGLFAVSQSLYEVTDKGWELVPYSSGFLYEIRVLDRFTVYASNESRPDADKLSAVALVAAATMTLITLLLLNAVNAGPRLRRFYAFAFAGLSLLAADELLGLHETIGHNLRFLADLPGVNRPDDVVFALYAIPLAVFAWSFRDVVMAHRRAVWAFAIGIGFFAVAVMADLAGSRVDEVAEAISGVCLVVGLVLITVTVLTRELDLEGIAASRRGGPASTREGASGVTLPAQGASPATGASAPVV